MKFITNHVIAFACAVTFFTDAGAQTSEQFQNQNGYKASLTQGALSKMTKWKTFTTKHDNPQTISPQQKMLDRMGIKPEADRLTVLGDYEFFGGELYKGNNVPYAAITDSDGNTYITGASTNETQPSGDFFTMKINAAGETVWEQRETAAIYAVEYGMHVAFDGSGNIVVSGLKWNGNDMDIRLIKYSADGSKIWDSTFNSAFSGIEVPNAMTIGNDGSIYIAGITWSGNSVDYLTLKYNNDGSIAWSKTENPAGEGSWNEATAVAVDTNGNVIITGYSPNPDGWLNYHTVKYDLQGTKLWEQAYNYESTDPENVAAVTNSTARGVTSDSDGSIYVTGTFDTFLGRIGTIKYNSNGQQQWIKTYKSENDMTMGWHIATQNNSIYVAGSHVGGFANDGTVLLSYNANGDENWVEETTDLIEAVNTMLSFDADGNIIAAAKGMTPGAEEWTQDVAARAHKYSPEGTELGQSAFVIVTATGTASMGDMAGAGLDNAGNIYFTANSYYSQHGSVFETVKTIFATNVAESDWNNVYTNLGSPAATMLNSFPDADGNTFSTGSYYNFANEMLNANYFLVKHNPEGTVAWNVVYNSENGNPADGIVACADTQGNSYVCLVPGFEEFPPVLRIKKISPEGTELWSSEVEVLNPKVYAMVPHQDGSLYLGGTAFENEDSEHASFVGIRINNDGTQAWKTFMQGNDSQNNIYQVNAGKVDNDGRLILTGAYGSGSIMAQDINLTTVQFNSDGTPGWMTPVAVDGLSSSGTDLYIANDGSIYINGFAQDNDTYYEDIVTTKLSASGEMQWVNTYGDANRNERSYTLKAFSNGDIAVIGYSLAQNGDIHNALIKYNKNGDQIWDFASENMRYYNDFHIDGNDVCYIMDQAIVDPFPHKIFTAPFPIASLIKVSANGSTAEEEFFVGPEYAEFYGQRLIPHADDRLLLAGSVGNQAFYEGTYFFETEHEGTLGTDDFTVDTQKNMLGQNYPNPVQDSTTIPFYLLQDGYATIKLYNLQGRFITEIANDHFAQGHNTFQFSPAKLAPGIYFYQIQAGKFRQARKMVIK